MQFLEGDWQGCTATARGSDRRAGACCLSRHVASRARLVTLPSPVLAPEQSCGRSRMRCLAATRAGSPSSYAHAEIKSLRTEKATRAGRRELARITLQREVRTAAAGTATAEDFVTRLADADVLLRPWLKDNGCDVMTGYAVALAGRREPDVGSAAAGSRPPCPCRSSPPAGRAVTDACTARPAMQ